MISRLIAAALGPLATRFDIDVVAECDSTNARLLAAAVAGAPSGKVIAAGRQTAGRGRMGRPWVSAPGDSLTFSLLWRLPQGVVPAGLSLVAGVAVAEALRSSGIDGVALKWPNDILREGRKLGGILVELAGTAAVIGVGLNLRLPAGLSEDVRRNAAALGPGGPDRNELFAALLAALHGVLETFVADGFATLRERWRAMNAHANMPVRLLSGFSLPLDGIFADVDEDGALLLETPTGIRRILSGDVSLRAA